MTRRQAQALASVALAAGIVVTDQIIKVAVKTGMYLHQSIKVTNWFHILFTENDGMAFGIEWFDKLFLTIFRIIAVGVLIWYMHRLIKRGTRNSYLTMIALTTAGALGNIIDCIFYGQWFGYAPLFYGKVVDMLYFPIIDTTLPAHFPIWGGRHVIFVRPIFNIADSCITCGAIYLLLFQWKFFAKSEKKENSENNS